MEHPLKRCSNITLLQSQAHGRARTLENEGCGTRLRSRLQKRSRQQAKWNREVLAIAKAAFDPRELQIP